MSYSPLQLFKKKNKKKKHTNTQTRTGTSSVYGHYNLSQYL